MTLTKLKKIIVFVIILAVYLNIGWGLGYYFENNISYQDIEQATFTAKVFAGHCFLFSSKEFLDTPHKHNFLFNVTSMMILWPFALLLSLLSWIGHIFWWGISWLSVLFWNLLIWLCKMIFFGGIARALFGLP